MRSKISSHRKNATHHKLLFNTIITKEKCERKIAVDL